MPKPLRLALVADTFPPLRNSGAVQLRDLAREFARQGHQLTVLLPDSTLDSNWQVTEQDGVRLVRLKAPRTKDIGYVRRTLAECMMPFAMRRQLRRSPLAGERWDGVIWYSPSIFHGPLVRYLKQQSRCKSYLIIRDIFPEWAVDMGLMGKGLPYWCFRSVAGYQYSVADTIGVQTPGNLVYFANWQAKTGKVVEVLQNWLDAPGGKPCPLRLEQTALAGRQLFVYAGNMGVAQGMDIMLALAERHRDNSQLGFVFVGRGSEVARLQQVAASKQLGNVLFFDEIDPDEIPQLYARCAVGLLALSPLHRSHNIPGKFLTYMQSGLPVLANINAGNDLAAMIRREQVGAVCESNDIDELYQLSVRLLDQLATDPGMAQRCRQLFERTFSVDQTVRQIVAALA